MNRSSDLLERARALRLWGLVADWNELADSVPIEDLIRREEEVRAQRSLERRLREAKIGRFKSIADFAWTWPAKCDRQAIEELLELRFVGEGANAILAGPNGVGKTTIAKNVAHQALVSGHTVRFDTAAGMLNHLAAQDGATSLRRAFNRFVRPALLVVDELGYLSYTDRHADLLFEVVSRRYDTGRAILITTNKPFSQWSDIFPNATCVVTLVDRLVHRCDIIDIEGGSFRLKEAEERAKRKRSSNKAKKSVRATRATKTTRQPRRKR